MNHIAAIATSFIANAALGATEDRIVEAVEDRIGQNNWKANAIIFVVGGSVVLLGRAVTRRIMANAKKF